MSDIRLDPATLRWCATWSPRYVLKAARQHFEAYAAEAEARTPLLSDWVRACEGTALGEPDWRQDEVYGVLIAAFDKGVQVRLAIDCDNSGAQPSVDGEYAGFTCRTPAELRGALDHLAKEEKKA